MKGTLTEIPTTKGKLIIKAEDDFMTINNGIVLNFMQVMNLRNKLTKMIDNKRARDRYRFK